MSVVDVPLSDPIAPFTLAVMLRADRLMATAFAGAIQQSMFSVLPTTCGAQFLSQVCGGLSSVPILVFVTAMSSHAERWRAFWRKPPASCAVAHCHSVCFTVAWRRCGATASTHQALANEPRAILGPSMRCRWPCADCMGGVWWPLGLEALKASKESGG